MITNRWRVKTILLKSLIVIGFRITCPLLAQQMTTQFMQVTNVQRVDFPPNGALRLKKSVGNVRILAWDQPNVEITTVISSTMPYEPQSREAVEKQLKEVHVTGSLQGSEMVIETTIPPKSVPFDLEYEVKVPGRAQVYVDHHRGSVYVENVEGEMRMAVPKGQITLLLPREAQYAIDARSKFGGVSSFIPGRTTNTFWPPPLGQKFESPGGEVHASASLIEAIQNRGVTATPPAGATKLFLRVGSGDIDIFQTPDTRLNSASIH